VYDIKQVLCLTFLDLFIEIIRRNSNVCGFYEGFHTNYQDLLIKIILIFVGFTQTLSEIS